MRRLLLILIALLTAVTPLTLTACKDKLSREEKILASFESYEELFTMQFSEFFGEVTLSDKHATEGSKSVFWDITRSSMSLWPIHTENVITMPNLLIFPDKVGFDSIEKVDYFAIDVYNDGASDLFVGVRMVDGNWVSALSNTQIAEKGVQKTLRFYFNDLFPQEKKANLIRLQIMLFNEKVNQEGIKVYFDNFRVVTSDTQSVCDAVVENNTVVKFDKPEHQKYVNLGTQTDIEVAVKGYKNDSLCLTWLPTRGYTYWIFSNMGEDSNKMQLSFYKGLLELIDLTKVKTLSVDVYNDCIESKKVDFWYTSGKKTYDNTTVVNGKTWTTVSVELEHIPETFGLGFNMAENLNVHDTLIRNLRFTV